jgi:hypothetical protein
MSFANLPTPPEPTPAPPRNQVDFHQIKSNFFRVVHADGTWVSVHPLDLVHITFFSERAPIAKKATYNLTPEGFLADEDLSKRDSKIGYVREMEVDVVLSRAAVASLHKWLTNYLEGTLQMPPKKLSE